MKNLIRVAIIASLLFLFSGCFVAIGSSPDTVIQNNPYANKPYMGNPPYYSDYPTGYEY